MNFVKINSASIDNLGRRVLKFLRLGNSDVQTALEAMPFGVDAVPTKDLVAIYAPTSEKGKTVIIGYLNKKQLARIGEHRTYSTDENGTVVFSIYQKNDGTCEIGGNSDNMCRYAPLNAAMSNLANAINQQLTLIATGITTAGGTYTPTPITIDVSGVKVEQIKTL